VTVRLGRIEGQEVAGLGEMSHLVLSTDLRDLNQQKMLVRFLSTIGSQFAQKRKETQALTYILRLPVKIMQSGREHKQESSLFPSKGIQRILYCEL